MNYLALTNRLRQECGVTGSDLTSLTGLTGESLRCKQWINDAYVELQNRHQDWQWLRTAFSFTTTADQQVYTTTDVGISATFGAWKPDSFRVYVTASGYAGEMFMGFYRDYEAWRDLWQFGANRTNTGHPINFAITPAKSIGLSPVPDDTGYTVLGDYYKAPSELSATTDEPAFPDKYHMILVYDAMKRYGVYEAASEVYQRGGEKFQELLKQLENDQLPEMCAPEPLL